MARWITFDEKTADALRSRVLSESAFESESVFEAPGRTALEYALSSPGNIVTVLNAGIENRCAVALFRRPPAHETITDAPQTFRASGILGLGDEPVFEEEEKPRAKSFWRRLWED